MIIKLLSLFTLVAVGTAQAAPLQAGDLYRGKVLIGTNPSAACFLAVKNQGFASKEKAADLVTTVTVFTKNEKMGHTFNVRNYNESMTGRGSSYLTKYRKSPISLSTDLTFMNDPSELIQIQLNANASPQAFQVYSSETVRLNCVNLQKISARSGH